MAHRRPARGAPRKSVWFGFQPVEVTMGAAGTAAVFSLNAAALALRPFTIVRTHFELKAMSDQAAAVENYGVALGLAVVSDQAVTVGITALPLPVTDMASGLFFVHKLLFGDGTRVVDQTTDSSYATIDSKAMRKVDIGQDIVVIMQSALIGAGSFSTVGGRMLVKTH